jgi:hypothetical protein
MNTTMMGAIGTRNHGSTVATTTRDLWKINDFGLDPGSEWAKETYDDSQWRSGRTIAGE